MLKKILLGIVVIVAALLLYAAMRPDSFSVERSITVKAPPDKLFPYVSNLHEWQKWSPWEKLDPGMQRTFGGPEAGKGSSYAWKGNKDVGQGRMEILETVPPQRVRIKLDFIEPFEANDQVDFTLTPVADGTTVRWLMQGPMPYISKLMSVFVSMDRLIGKDFEAGLANLKALAER